MSENSSSRITFTGVLASELGCDPNIGDVVTVQYLGVDYPARVTARRADFDDFGTEMTRFDLESIDKK